MPLLNFKGGSIHYKVSGIGKSIVLIHGFLGSEAIFHDTAAALSTHFRVIVPDLPGHGKSGNFGYLHTMELMAQSIKAIVDELNIHKVFLTGHSMGGYVALAFTENYPQLVEGICLLNSVPFADSDKKKTERTRAINAVKSNHNIYIKGAILQLFSKEHLKQNKKEFQRVVNIAAKTKKRGIIAAMEGMIKREDRRKLLAGIRQKSFAITGRHDTVFANDLIKDLQQIIKKENYYLLENSGHMSMLEESEKTIQILKSIIVKVTKKSI